MSIGLYISHPEVDISPHIPVGQWTLSSKGKMRAHDFAKRHLIPHGTPIFSSTETKAMELARILAAVTNSKIVFKNRLAENDRSATGFLPPEQFEQHVKKLFAYPNKSVAGWETACDAQSRIVAAIQEILKAHDNNKPIIFTGHGCVGTLLKCHFAGSPIAQSQDQREMADIGGGNIFAFDLAQKNLLCDWTPMENWTGTLS